MGSGTPDGSGASMASAREEEQLALMDRKSTGLEVVPAAPSGRPTTYGPERTREESRKKDGKGQGGAPLVEVNPFWSQTLKDEVMLRAMRATSLPSAPTASSTAEPSMAEDMGMDMRENLFLEYEETGRPALGQIKTPEEEGAPGAEDVARAQKETAELLWVAGRTRPDISMAVNTVCQWTTKRPKGAAAIGRQSLT